MSRLLKLSAVAAVVSASALACGLPGAHDGDPGVPAPRTDASSAYDPSNQTIVMFGGANSTGVLAETWTWDGSRWRRQHPAQSPPARERALMAFDPATKNVVLFGGQTCAPPAPHATLGCEYATDTTSLYDTWSWDGSSWSAIKTAHAPDVAHFQQDMSAMGSDPATGQLILLAWVPEPSATNPPKTWTLAGGDWTQLHPPHSPFDDEFGGVVFDAASKRLILLQPGAGHYECGGASCFQPPVIDMTWTWDGTDWQNLGPAVNTPHDSGGLVEAGAGGAMYVDDGGGFTIWDGKQWESRALLPWAGYLRLGWTGAFDVATGDVIVYGGREYGENHLFGDTRAWNGKTWRTVVPAPASPSAPLASCSAGAAESGYGAGQTSAPGGEVFEVGFSEVRSGPCHIDAVIHFTLVDGAGNLIAIPGNPAQVRISSDLTFATGFVYATFTVSNACGLPGGVIGRFTSDGLDVQIGGGVRTPCSGPVAPSVLTAGTRTNPDEH
jgi:hypothetical protein